LFYLIFKSGSPADIVNNLSDLIIDKPFTARVVKSVGYVIHVTLTDESGVDVLSQLTTAPSNTRQSDIPTELYAGRSDAYIPPELDGSAPTEEILMYLSPAIPGGSDRVFVSHIVSPTDFYVQLGTSSDILTELSDGLQFQYNNLFAEEGRLEYISVGTVCCAR